MLSYKHKARFIITPTLRFPFNFRESKWQANSISMESFSFELIFVAMRLETQVLLWSNHRLLQDSWQWAFRAEWLLNLFDRIACWVWKWLIKELTIGNMLSRSEMVCAKNTTGNGKCETNEFSIDCSIAQKTWTPLSRIEMMFSISLITLKH